MNAATHFDFCLLIPCYNNTAGLRASLQTVRYTPNLFLIVVVDDGSDVPVSREDLTNDGLDLPVHLIRLKQNSGITVALNTGLAWIVENTTSKYIARLDCGDRCRPDRFFKQIAFLDRQPAVGLLGSWCVFKEERSGDSFNYKAPLADMEIKKAMHLRNVFIHPTVMWRSRLLPESSVYPYNFPHAEDYAFFWALLKRTKGAILNEFLVTCSIRANGISSRHRRQQLKSCEKVIRLYGDMPVRKWFGILLTQLRMVVPQKVIFLLKRWKSNVYII